MFGVYILISCGVGVGITVLGTIGYHTMKAAYWLITDRIDWNFTNITLVIWCIIAMIGILCIIIGIFQDIILCTT